MDHCSGALRTHRQWNSSCGVSVRQLIYPHAKPPSQHPLRILTQQLWTHISTVYTYLHLSATSSPIFWKSTKLIICRHKKVYVHVHVQVMHSVMFARDNTSQNSKQVHMYTQCKHMWVRQRGMKPIATEIPSKTRRLYLCNAYQCIIWPTT